MEPLHTEVRTTATSEQEGRLKVDAGKRRVLRKIVKKRKKRGSQ